MQCCYGSLCGVEHRKRVSKERQGKTERLQKWDTGN